MLGYLVTSKARRRLLELLWGQGARGSVTELAKRAGVGFANAYRELHAMKRLGLAVSERKTGAETFRAGERHPLAAALRALVAAPGAGAPDVEAERTRGLLRTLGAPLPAEPAKLAGIPLEEVLVRGVALAHRDPAVARALPLCFWKSRDRIDPQRLREAARGLGERQAVGFFLELTAELSGDRRLAEWSKAFRDGRRRIVRDLFLVPAGSKFQSRLAEERTPGVARRWGLRMNMDLDSFRSLFDRFAHAA
ncbi:MAG: hypothetical protein HY907_05935 [Deltaproteobacteria bacterium]|nr:hypothetical protein [Deltaproteobacteria bacterium]